MNLTDIAFLAKLVTSTAASVLNALSVSTTQPYSANFVNENFTSKALTQNLWWIKGTPNRLETEQPSVNANNTITAVTTNQGFLETPQIVITRTVVQGGTINPTTQMVFNLRFSVSRAGTLDFAVRIKAHDNTVFSAPSQISTGNYETGSTQGVIFTATFDQITEPFSILAGETITIEIFTKQSTAAALTTTYYAGVDVNGTNTYCWNRWLL